MKAFLFLFPLAAAAMQSAPSHTVLFDTSQVKVINASVTPGPKGKVHKHDVNRVMIHLDEGQMELDYQGSGVKPLKFKAGVVRWDPAGGMHTSQITGTKNFRIIEVEIKKPKGSPVQFSPLDPVKVDSKHYKVEFENDQVRVVRAKFPAGYQTPQHEHVLPRVVVYLSDYALKVTGADGKVTQPKGSAGDVTMPTPSKHIELNTNNKVFEVVVVELKTR